MKNLEKKQEIRLLEATQQLSARLEPSHRGSTAPQSRTGGELNGEVGGESVQQEVRGSSKSSTETGCRERTAAVPARSLLFF